MKIEKHSYKDGYRTTFSFENGWGASVVPDSSGEENWRELAVLDRFGEINYDTEITSDVVRIAGDNMLIELLAQIAELDDAPDYSEEEAQRIAEEVENELFQSIIRKANDSTGALAGSPGIGSPSDLMDRVRELVREAAESW